MRNQRIVARIALQFDRGCRILAADQDVVPVTTDQMVINTRTTDQCIVASLALCLEVGTTAVLDGVVAAAAQDPAAIFGNQIIIASGRLIRRRLASQVG